MQTLFSKEVYNNFEPIFKPLYTQILFYIILLDKLFAIIYPPPNKKIDHYHFQIVYSSHHAVVITSGHLSHSSEYLWSPLKKWSDYLWSPSHYNDYLWSPSQSSDYLWLPSQSSDYHWSPYTVVITSGILTRSPVVNDPLVWR